MVAHGSKQQVAGSASVSAKSSTVSASAAGPSPPLERGTNAANPSAPPPPFPGPPRTPQLGVDDLPPITGDGFSPEDSLSEQLDDLEHWVKANMRRDRRETIRFWLLRVPALTYALLTTATAPLAVPQLVATLAATVALLVVIDAAWPAATLQNPLTRALHDLRELQNTAKLRWDRVRLAYPEPNHPKRIAHGLALLDAIHAERQDIGKYLAGFVASPSVGRGPI